ncbi:hypothetical protein PV326_008758 [Microctonus aethiopoides]|nr:hypothetical protein PV326_008758 [Microctonus aethiopoides]
MGKLPLRVVEIQSRKYSLYQPDYLEAMKPKIPLSPVVNVQIKGYVYPILENYQRLIDTIATNMDIDIDASYGIPAKKLKIDKYKSFSAVTECEYILNLYERNIQISNLPFMRLPIFIRLLEAAIPEGVTLKIEVWDPDREEMKYIPDKELLDLKGELETMARK